jgi:hypothetical protein
VIGVLICGFALVGCGDNVTPPQRRAGVQSSVSGGMVATSRHYKIVSTVTSADVNGVSSNHVVRGGVVGEGGGQ